MKFRNDGWLDMRFSSSQSIVSSLYGLGFVIAIIAVIIYVVYSLLLFLLPLTIIIIQFKYFKKIKTKFKLFFILSFLFTYIITLDILVNFNISEPVNIYGTYNAIGNDYDLGGKYNEVQIKILDNKKFLEDLGNQVKYNDGPEEENRRRSLINFANSNPDLPIIELIEYHKVYKARGKTYTYDGPGRSSWLWKYSHYGFLHKKKPRLYEVAFEKSYDVKNSEPFDYYDSLVPYSIKFFIKDESVWHFSFRGINFRVGTIILPRFIILAALISVIVSCLLYLNFKKSKNIFKEEKDVIF